MVDLNAEPFVLMKIPILKDEDEKVVAEYSLHLPLYVAWDIVEIVQELGIDRAVRFARFALIVARAGHAERPTPTEDEMIKLRATISHLANLFSRQWSTFEDRVLDFTYQFLQHSDMDRKMAAEFAAMKLKKGPVDDAWREAWRKRVDRWAKSHKLPLVGNPRKPRKVIRMRGARK